MKYFVKTHTCKCKPDFVKMKNTTLYLAEGFIMIYGCPHTKIGQCLKS